MLFSKVESWCFAPMSKLFFPWMLSKRLMVCSVFVLNTNIPNYHRSSRLTFQLNPCLFANTHIYILWSLCFDDWAFFDCATVIVFRFWLDGLKSFVDVRVVNVSAITFCTLHYWDGSFECVSQLFAPRLQLVKNAANRDSKTKAYFPNFVFTLLAACPL